MPWGYEGKPDVDRWISLVTQRPVRNAYVNSGNAITKGATNLAVPGESAVRAFVRPGIARIAANPQRR
jgi:hypothetical protein